MEFLSSLNQSQIAGIIAQLIALPFIVVAAKKWWLANQSKQWLTTTGKVIIGLDFTISSGHLVFLYEYEINGITYQGKKPFFAISFKNLRGKKSWELIEKYPKGKQIDVFYNSANPKISILEPGRKDGVLSALLLLLFIFLLGFISYYRPSIIVAVIDYFLNL